MGIAETVVSIGMIVLGLLWCYIVYSIITEYLKEKKKRGELG